MSRTKLKFFGTLISIFVLLAETTAFTADDYLQVAMHDRCNDDDLSCGLPIECCCKPSHNRDFRTSLGSSIPPGVGNQHSPIPVHVLCVNISKLPPTFPAEIESFKLLGSNITELSEGSFTSSSQRNLSNIYIWKNPFLVKINDYAFDGLENLRTIILEDVPSLSVIEQHAFSNLPSLRELRLKRTGLRSVPMFTGLSSSSFIPLKIILEDSKLTRVQSSAFSSLPARIKIVQLSWNLHLTIIEDYAFNGSSIAQLILNDNKQLATLELRSFHGLDKLTKLNLAGTAISTLPTNGLHNLIEIDARRTPNLHRFPAAQELPSLRVASLTYTYHCCALNAYGFGRTYDEASNYKHRELTPCDDEDVKEFLSNSSRKHESTISDDSSIDNFDVSGYFDIDWDNYSVPDNVHPDINSGEKVFIYHESEDTDAYDGGGSFLQRFYNENFREGSWQDDYDDSTAPVPADSLWGWRPDRVVVPTVSTRTVQTIELCYTDSEGNKIRDVYKTPVKCTPKPDAFNPCENVLGNPVLPVISWVVSALAIIENFFVILVLSMVTFDRGSARQHNLSVQKFLVLNLAVADFCMGLYLLIVSAMDARTSGEYFKYGVEWQTGIGCRIAGFLSIFSSQLSVYTLSVISMERWYAIHYAIHLDKRMTMRCARICVLFGWLISIVLASLPLVGVNNYEKTSICLPFDVSAISGMVYVAVLLFIAIGAFFVDVICYLWMYKTVRTASLPEGARDSVFRRKRKGSISSAKSGTIATADATVAKRMAVLVFTNFACFFPISFFALTAAAGKPLISISNSKILLVVFYPLNSCCNPFLYAILTKSFRRDLLSWFTSRGYCIPLAAKLHGAQWRRNSADPGSGEKREMCVRKRLQQCVKYVSKRKTVHIGVHGEESSSRNARDARVIRSTAVVCPAKVEKNITEEKVKSNLSKRGDVDNNSNSFSSYHSITHNQPTAYMGMSRILKMAFMPKKSEKSTPRSAGYTRGTQQKSPSFFREFKWFQSHRKNSSNPAPSNDSNESPRAGAEDSSPLVEMSYDRNGCEYSVQTNESKPSYTYGRRASKSRHSTTTIETRLTVTGNLRRGSMDHEQVVQDVGVSTP